MNKIYKTMSLEDSKSRLPGLLSSIVNKEFVSFDDDYLKRNYSGNYGLIVSDIKIPNEFITSITDGTNIFINIPTTDADKVKLNDEFYLIQNYDVQEEKKCTNLGVNYYYIKDNNIFKNGVLEKYLNYYTLIKWYRFFMFYDEIICVTDCDGKRKYDSAESYYNSEVEYKNEESELYYKTLDETYISRGGTRFYKWINDNCIVTYEIPLKYQDGWNATHLYYPEVIKWKSWFTVRYKKYNAFTLETCDSSNDCKEYFKRGGNEMYNNLHKITLKHNGSETNSASINILLTIESSIDDMGEMSIFSNEWVSGENYHNNNEDYIDKTWFTKSGGALVTHNNKVMMLKDNNNYSGFTYDNKFKEILFDENQWENYYDVYKLNNEEEFEPNFTTFTHNRNNIFIADPTPSDVSEKFNIIKEEIYVIDEMIYKPFKSDFVTYKNHFYIVNYFDNGIPYTNMNSKTYIGLYVNGVYQFNFNYKPCITKDGFLSIEKSGKFISYNGGNYKINGNNVTIGLITYPKLDGYVVIDNSNYYISGTTLVKLHSAIGNNNTNQTYVITYNNDITFGDKVNGTITNQTRGYTITNEKIEIYFPYYIHKVNEITGETTSKLDLFTDFKKGYDDIGNQLPGLFNLIQEDNGTIFIQPKEGDTLDLYYTVGVVSDLTKMYDEENEVIDGQFFGNILTSIQFFYRNSYGEIINESVCKSKDYENNNLKAIEECLKKCEELKSKGEVLETEMSCDIEYYIGANIIQNKTGNDASGYKYSGYTYDNGGVMYTDSVNIIKKQTPYYLSESNDYILNYYDMVYPLKETMFNEYDNIQILNKKSKFLLKNDFYKQKTDNGSMASPNVRLEYKFGTSSLQNVKSDVYIDRGISNAIDKHLKLGEVGSFESLSQYSNGQFNIINNNN